jgi:hypothetical protein
MSIRWRLDPAACPRLMRMPSIGSSASMATSTASRRRLDDGTTSRTAAGALLSRQGPASPPFAHPRFGAFLLARSAREHGGFGSTSPKLVDYQRTLCSSSLASTRPARVMIHPICLRAPIAPKHTSSLEAPGTGKIEHFFADEYTILRIATCAESLLQSFLGHKKSC